MAAVDLALRDLMADQLELEHEYAGLMREAVAYRTMLHMALTAWAEDRDRAAKVERRLRQIMGIEPERPLDE